MNRRFSMLNLIIVTAIFLGLFAHNGFAGQSDEEIEKAIREMSIGMNNLYYVPLVKKGDAAVGPLAEAYREAIDKMVPLARSEGGRLSLSDKKRFFRERIVDTLARIGSKNAIDQLVEIMFQPKESVDIRMQAIKELTNLGAFEALGTYFQKGDPSLFEFVVDVLGDSRAPGALDALARVLHDKGNPVRLPALRELEKDGTPRAAAAMIAVLDDPNVDLVTAACRALAKLGKVEAVEKLAGVLMSDDGRRAQPLAAALEALASMGARSAEDKLLLALEGGNRNIRKAVAASLARLDSEKVLVKLDGLSKDPDPGIRIPASRALEEKKRTDRKTLVTVEEAKNLTPEEVKLRLLKDKDPMIRLGAVLFLRDKRSLKAVDPLILELEKKDSPIRLEVIDALGKIGSEKAVEPLAKVFYEEPGIFHTFRLEYSAFNALKKIALLGSEQAVLTIAKLLKEKDRDKTFILSVVEALGKIATPTAKAALVGALDHPFVDVKKKAALLVGRLRVPGALDPLIHLAVKAEDSVVRGNACTALGEIGSPKGVDALIEALQDKNSNVRRYAYLALKKISSPRAVAAVLEYKKNSQK